MTNDAAVLHMHMQASGDLERHLIDKLGPNYKQSSTTSTPAAQAPAAPAAAPPKQAAAAAPVQEASTERLQALVNQVGDEMPHD
jgi:prephenate dehydratase